MYIIDLEQFLEENKLKQKDLADIIGVSANMISMIIHGKAKMPQPKIKMILDAGIYKTSMIKQVKKAPMVGDTVSMSREVFDSIQKLVDTINSQQRTIESQQRMIENNMGGCSVQEADPAGNADAM